ncbi:NnrS family protein [uncultured Sulfitobacter sp.]|uniref:NnrS family protein n=1 Tax=uncultured Sulfitobacter sp. TaxID=191468 RepID=UPI0026193B96|nr:NnrS family protein [uncultured Sulfitobacter sp.]
MTSTEQMRQWAGPALFSYGFRPFFLFGAIWAAAAMVLWIAMLADVLTLPTRLDPVSWHAHEFLFGYLGAIIAGFLLTAVPNWTGRLPVVGWRLAALFGIWILGRVAIGISALLLLGLPETIDLLFPVGLSGLILREIIVGKNWKNLIVLVLLAVFTFANLLFHLDAAHGGIAAQGVGMRLGVVSILIMISVIGGRIVPSFTRNWMIKQGQTDLPTPPMQRFDKATLVVTALALGIWVFMPDGKISGVALVLIAGLHIMRLARWKGINTLSEPLLWVLHLAYLMIPLGALSEGFAILQPDLIAIGSAQHLWMAGGFALMTLAVMVRATLGHTGQDLKASPAIVAIFGSVIAAVVMRLCAGIWPAGAMVLYSLSAVFWIGAFGGFAVLMGPSLLRKKEG